MKKKALRVILLVVICFFIITTCKKDEKITDIEITEVQVVDNSIKISGTIISLSGNKNSEYGVAYSIRNSSPVITDTVARLGLPQVGPFTAEIKNLKRNKTYYVRGFIKEGDSYLYADVRTAVIASIEPVATTMPETSLAETSATLNGSVNPNGSTTLVSFEYGLTSSYGSTVDAVTNIISGTSATAVSANLTGLTPNTTYHYRVKAVNAAGTALGGDSTFKTRANVVAPVVTTTEATPVANTTATLNGSVNPNGSTATVTFEYGTTILAYESTANATPATVSGIIPTKVSAALTGLVPGQLYHYRIKAVNAGGTTYSEDLTFTTTQPPTVTTLDATKVAQTSATLNGQVNANGLTTTITFEYGPTSSYGSIITGVPANASGTTITPSIADITGLTEGTTYHFRIKAVSTAGTTVGTDLTFTPSAVPIVAPTVSTTVVTDITQTTAKSGGNITSDGGATLTASGVCWNTVSNPTISDSKTSDGIATGIFTSSIAGLTAGTKYYIRAYATNSTGTGYGNEVSFETPPPAPSATTMGSLNIYPTTATIYGVVNGNGIPAAIKFEFGTTTAYGNILFGMPDNASMAGDVSSTLDLTGLTKSTLYHFRIFAENYAGTTYGEDMTFTTLENDPVIPIISTKAVTAITSQTATGGGIITSDGGAEVTARGICYSISPTPTIDDSRTANDEGTGEFSSPFTGLTPSTLYYVRAYATNMIGTAYGNEVSFTTAAPPAVLPTLTTTTITNIAYSSASGGGDITDDGGGTITVRGVCWSTSELPTTTDFKTQNGTGSGPYTSSITGLDASTLYYVRAYATNSAGTAYGDQLTFATSDPPAGFATLTTVAGSAITNSSATSGGNITDDGGGTITDRGVCWSTSTGPEITDSKTSNGTGTGTFISNITDLSPSTQYYVRAFATNEAGTAYGNQITITTLAPDPVLPTVTTASVTEITHISGTGGGNITDDGYAPITSRGICWSTLTGPTTDNSSITIGSGTGTFSGSMAGLDFSTKYYVRAWARNSVGIVYGNEVTFTSSPLPYVIPTLTTTPESEVTSSKATTGGNISDNGGDPVTDRGVCYGNSENPTILDNITSDGTGIGGFTSNLTELSGSTLYYVRAYATNNAGTAYGNQISFTTPVEPGAPLLTTTAATSVGTTTATSGGNITDDGDAGGPITITAKGVCWSTSANPTIANSKTSDGTGTVPFTSSLTSLIPCTTYHIRAYATNDAGFTAYGSDKTFTTGSVLPTVTTTALTSPTSISVSTGGNVSGNCASTVTERGVCWSTSSSPTTSDSKLTNGSGSGSYAISITGLTPCTKYYIRAYAINGSGPQYGNELSFTTSTVKASVTTTSATSVTATTANTGGTVSGDCTTGATRGICYATTQNPTTSNSTINSGTGAGAYSIPLSGLTPCTTYYVRAFVTNSAGTAYATQTSFTTGSALPTVVTTAVSGIAAYNAVSGGTVSGNCNSAITARGVCWSTSQNPTVGLTTKTVQTGTSGSFSSNITSLSRVTTYYVRAYATNGSGTAYGNQVSFTTLPVAPTVSTSTISNIISGTITNGGGNVSDDGGATVTARGVCWSTSYNPTATLTTKTTDGTGTGSFTSYISGLAPGTFYYVRAYATNSAGTNYGINRSFSTPANVTDHDGNVYGAVNISGHTWMQSNLKVKHWADAPIGGGGDTSQYIALPLWWQYNDNSSNGSTYGLMYNWSAVTSTYNICPSGWHVPSSSEWSTLSYYIGGNTTLGYQTAGAKMNDVTRALIIITFPKGFFPPYSYWNNEMTGHDNSSLFNGRGGGYYSGAYYGLKDNTRWWSSTSLRYVKIQYNSNYLYGTSYGGYLTGLSSDAYYIRCKKD